jgi:hypothetical protein
MTKLEILILVFIIVYVVKEALYYKFFAKRISNIEIIIADYFTNKENKKQQVGF